MNCNNNLFAELRQYNHSEINGRNVWLFQMETSIGEFQVVQWEMPGKEIIEKIFRWDYPQALKHYNTVCRKILAGKM